MKAIQLLRSSPFGIEGSYLLCFRFQLFKPCLPIPTAEFRIKGLSGGGIGKQRPNDPKFLYESPTSTPADWSFVSLQPLPYGTTIDASTPWGGEQTSEIGGGFVDIDQGLSNAYYGLKFYASPGVYNYGWMQVSTPGDDLTFGNIAVETIANTSIGAGAVPEPSTYALLALAGGAAAVSLLRKKRGA